MWTIIFTGVLIHLVFLSSIFDIYFTSPIVHGMAPQQITLAPPAKRIFLFVADGLRADKFFDRSAGSSPRMPFLYKMALEQGTAGISNTRVPTESRPGHVALIAGFYEDVSAVTKGWKENPVEFDSVFNQSRFTWAWGSPDIVTIFNKVKSDGGVLTEIPHIFSHTYSSEFEDFAGSPIQLDEWVFDRFSEFLDRSYKNATLREMLTRDKVVLFFHLLGMDTTGHVFKPSSKIYDENMRKVDLGIEKIVQQVGKFYSDDNQTAFVFTSDHGMTDWGSHGSGYVDETETPMIAWGAGITKQWKSNMLSSEISHMVNIEQADVAALMSALIGVAVPVNSVGRLPLEYLAASSEYRAAALLANVKQIYEQLRIKMVLKRSQTFSSIFTPFSKLTEGDWNRKISAIEDELGRSGGFPQAVREDLQNLISLELEGLQYYQTYDRYFLSAVIVLGYLGWMIYIISVIGEIPSNRHVKKSNPRIAALAGITFGSVVTGLLLGQGSPRVHLLYGILPVFTLSISLNRLAVLKHIVQQIFQQWTLAQIILTLLQFVVGTEILVLTFFFREVVSVGLVLSGIWLMLTTKSTVPNRVMWMITSLSLSIFPMMRVIGNSKNLELVFVAGFIGAAIVIAKAFSDWKLLRRDVQSSQVMLLQIFSLFLAIILVFLTARSVNAQVPPGLFNQSLSWILLGCGFIVPLLGSTLSCWRFICVIVSLLSSYLLMSVSYEGFFFVLLCVHLYLWIDLESQTVDQKVPLNQLTIFDSSKVDVFAKTRALQTDDVRRAFFFVFFLLSAFFGTGNIASINSFDPASAFCFVTVFRPFVMGTILLCKVIIPFLAVGCAFHIVHVVCKLPMKSLFLVVLLISDCMALHFFFLVKTEGSWLDIGTSISHYVMVMVLIVFTSALNFVSSILMTKRINLFQFPRLIKVRSQ